MVFSAHVASAEEDGGWEGLSVCTLKLGQVRGFVREPGWFVGGARSILLEVGSLVRRVVVGVSGDSEGCRRVDPGVGGPLDEFFFFAGASAWWWQCGQSELEFGWWQELQGERSS